ncbi:MAG TPA: ComEA family DNA-binding protein [Acidimicrobiia bacterium]|nr:ComEA family DNA-binding protein [Acidimicrobiia bacterium]
MSDHLASGDPAERAGQTAGAGRGILAVWHRVRSGEDPIAFGAVAVVLALLAGLAWFQAGSRHGGVPAAEAAPRSPVVDPPRPASPGPDRPAPPVAPPLAVHVAGAVRRPGLYQLPPGSRVADAVQAAGGSLPRAHLDRLNLAARLVDGQKILVTLRGEPVPPDATGPGTVGGAGPDPGAPGNLPEPIDLNAADLAALDSLPGIGPSTARAILEERNRRGGFRSTRDLLRVPGIGEGRFARLKDRVRV